MIKLYDGPYELIRTSALHPIHSELLLSGKSFTRQKIRLKPSCRISASFVTLSCCKKH